VIDHGLHFPRHEIGLLALNIVVAASRDDVTCFRQLGSQVELHCIEVLRERPLDRSA